MRYSEYFVQVALLAEKGDTVEAERLLRKAEKLASPVIVNHLILCAKAWMILRNPDNAVRCLLEAECNNSDVRSLLEISAAYLKLQFHSAGCRRCLKKALKNAETKEDTQRLQEFFNAYKKTKGPG